MKISVVTWAVLVIGLLLVVHRCSITGPAVLVRDPSVVLQGVLDDVTDSSSDDGGARTRDVAGKAVLRVNIVGVRIVNGAHEAVALSIVRTRGIPSARVIQEGQSQLKVTCCSIDVPVRGDEWCVISAVAADDRRGMCCVAPLGDAGEAECAIHLSDGVDSANVVHVVAMDLTDGRHVPNAKVNGRQLDPRFPPWHAVYQCDDSGYTCIKDIPHGQIVLFVDGANPEMGGPYSIVVRQAGCAQETWVILAAPEASGMLKLTLTPDVACARKAWWR